MSRRVWSILLVSLFISCCFPNASSGYELLEPGARANSLAGAFIGISDDWTAIYWNPAGLFQPLDRELAIEGEYLSLNIKDGNSISNEEGIFGKHRLSAEPTSFSQETASQTRYLPSIGFVSPLEGLAFGLGIYPRLSDYLDWEDDDTQNLEASLMRRLQIYNGGIGFSTHIAPVIYVGAGLNVLYGEHELLAKKEYKGASPYTFKYHLKQGSGIGLEVILGALYEPQQLLSVGVVYRSGGTIDLRGDAEASRGSDEEDSSYTKRIYLPPNYGIGLVFRHIPKTTVGIDWSRVGWDSWREDYEFADEGTSLLMDPDEDEKNPGWRGADKWRLGFEVQPNPKWRIMLGGFYSQSPLPSSGIDMANGMVEMDRLGVSGGLGYKVGNWEFDLGYLLSNGQDEIDDVEYQRNVSKAQLSIKAHFF